MQCLSLLEASTQHMHHEVYYNTSFLFCARSLHLNEGACPTVTLNLFVLIDAAVLCLVKDKLKVK